MKHIYQILSYAVVIIVTAIVVSNLKFASNLDYKNEIENLHKQNDSLKANIDSNKVIIKSLSLEIITYKDKIEEDKKSLANLKIKAKKNKDKYNEESNRINSLNNASVISEFTNAFE
jgi:cell division protein FtsB